MAEFCTIAISEIVVPERIRPVDEEHAKVIAASIASEGLLNPITVRLTPNAKGGTYTLVAGAHRLRAVEMNGDDTIDAIIVKADQSTAQILEISENLFRNELSVIDRALFVQTYRELWEAQHGEIRPGGDGSNQYATKKEQLGQVAPIALNGEPVTFAKHVADRLGLSPDATKRLNRISQNLNPELRGVLRGTSVADNQAWLLKLAKLEPAKQRQLAMAFREKGDDVRAALALVEGGRERVAAVDSQDKILARLVTLWGQASTQTRAAFEEYCSSQVQTDAEDAA